MAVYSLVITAPHAILFIYLAMFFVDRGFDGVGISLLGSENILPGSFDLKKF